MKKIIKLAIADFKIIFRDSSLKAFLVLPVILFALIVWWLPILVEKYDFLTPYLPVFMIVAVIENTQMFCFIGSMVLIDEKETEVARAYGIVPLSKFQYIISRFLLPYLFTVLLNVLLFIVQPFYEITIWYNLIISLLAGLVVPVYVMAINSIVQNRMQGMVYVKAFNMIVLVPIAAFFMSDKIKIVFGIFPTHWIFQSVDYAIKNHSIVWTAGIGFLFMTGLLWFTSRSFIRKHFI